MYFYLLLIKRALYYKPIPILLGGNSKDATPDSIPNSEVKSLSVDDTAVFVGK